MLFYIKITYKLAYLLLICVFPFINPLKNIFLMDLLF
jgi:hypothetical protein